MGTKPRFKYDFSNKEIKQGIEHEFYTLASQYLKLTVSEGISTVTGPDWRRHVKNLFDVFGKRKLNIYEINDDIYVNIYQESREEDLIKVEHSSIETAKTSFIDCDLTCISDVEVIERTLTSQIINKAGYPNPKAFIATVGLRGNDSSDYDSIFRRLFGLLGARCQRVMSTTVIPLNLGLPYFKHNLKFQLIKSRIEFYKCYVYNAGGGPMITLLIIYK